MFLLRLEVLTAPTGKERGNKSDDDTNTYKSNRTLFISTKQNKSVD